MQTVTFFEPDRGRPCDGCTKCCEGWLKTNIYGHEVKRFQPCIFLGKSGCNIYNVRPDDPCKIFVCEWKADLNIPEWLKPDKANVIIIKQRLGDFYYDVIVTAKGPVISEEVHKWADEFSKTRNYNIAIYDDLVANYTIYSSNEEFKKLAAMTIQAPNFKK